MYHKGLELDSLSKRFKANNPLSLIRQKESDLKNTLRLLNKNIRIILDKKNQEFNIYTSKLNALNPLNLMDKGYSIPSVDGRAIKSVKDVKKDSVLNVRMKDGSITTKVMEVYQNGEGK